MAFQSRLSLHDALIVYYLLRTLEIEIGSERRLKRASQAATTGVFIGIGQKPLLCGEHEQTKIHEIANF
jgi:hypothetical protein